MPKAGGYKTRTNTNSKYSNKFGNNSTIQEFNLMVSYCNLCVVVLQPEFQKSREQQFLTYRAV